MNFHMCETKMAFAVVELFFISCVLFNFFMEMRRHRLSVKGNCLRLRLQCARIARYSFSQK